MTDNKLTDNEIKQALECCSGNFACDKCSMNFKATLKTNETCGHDLMKLALDLINRQNSEIERLQENNKHLDDCLKVTYRLIGEMIGE